MDDVDRALVVRLPLAEAGEVAEVATCREHRRDARNLRDRFGVLEALERFDHQDQHEVVVDRLPVAAGHAPPHRRVERLAATVTALAERREVGPVARGRGFFDRVDSRDDEHERAGVERVLLFALVGVRDADARHRLRVRAGAPHVGDFLPVARVVLHLSPDEIVARVRKCAVRRRLARSEQRPARHLLTRHHLQLHRIPDLAVGGRVPRRAVLPLGHVESALIHRAGRRDVLRVAVLPGLRCKRECAARGDRVFSRARLLARGLLLRAHRNHVEDDRERGDKKCLLHIPTPRTRCTAGELWIRGGARNK